MSTLFKRLWQTFQDKEYRHAYAEGFSDSKIATQMKVLREQRGWTQQQLAEAAGMIQFGRSHAPDSICPEVVAGYALTLRCAGTGETP